MTADEVRVVVEAIAPVVREYVTKTVTDLTLRLAAAELQVARLPLAEAAVSDLEKTLSTVRERVAVVEARPPQPGPEGPPGPPGRDGIDGKAGLRYVGIYDGTKAYEPGDLVTYAGSTWHCNEPTTTTPREYAGAQAWTLCVKKGRDGRDGKDGIAVTKERDA